MGVPKIAVMAIVAIVAIPILMGYALNLNETVIKDYKTNNDPVNVTQLLQTGTGWSIAQGDPYQMNNSLQASFNWGLGTITPIYNKISNVKTTLPLKSYDTYIVDGERVNNFQNYRMWEYELDYVIASGYYVTAYVYDDNGYVGQCTNVVYIHWDKETSKLNYVGYYNTDPDTPTETGFVYTVPTLDYIEFDLVGFSTVDVRSSRVEISGTNTYADISDGFYFKKFAGKPRTKGWDIGLPDNSISVLLSIDLDSITASNYTMIIEGDQNSYTPIKLVKTTTGGVVSWQVLKGSTVIDNLYYDPNISHNTYQVLFTENEPVWTDSGGGYYTYYGHVEFRYIGSWQKTIGVANYFQKYELDYSQLNDPVLKTINLRANDGTTSRTPTVRIDAAQFRAFEYPIMENTTYNAADFKTNPSTSITNINQYGSQIIFGGSTFNVTNGSITIDGHKVPVEGLIFKSVPNTDTVTYDNKIGNTIISTTANPSSIQFVGKWSATVITSSMEETSYTKTEWTPGQFGWDGIDANFLMVGMFAALGTLIGLGIYARSHNIRIWPVLLVCGGAILLFFCMI